MTPPEFIIRHIEQVKPTQCPCGDSFRIITALDHTPASFHVVEIDGTAQKHYHEHHTEYYYCLEGSGQIELNDQRLPFKPGTCIMIPSGTPHAARGKFKIIKVVVPPFDPEDEVIVEASASQRPANDARIGTSSSASKK